MIETVRKEFHTLVSLDEARALAAALGPARRSCRIPLDEALGRVVAEDVVASRDVPPFTRSTMDGFAVRAAETILADEEHPVILRRVGHAEAGRPAPERIGRGETIEIATGAPLPAGANAVVQVEHTDADGSRVLVRRGVTPGENVMSAGDDMMRGDVVLAAGTRLGPVQIGLLAAAGEADVTVWAAPRVGIASIGDELRPAGSELRPGQIHDANGVFLAAAVRAAGGDPVPLGILADEPADIEAALLEAARSCDLLLSSGSTSAGAGDVVYRILARSGETLAHGVRVEPGKPTVIGRLAGTPFVGLPGNPASAAVVFDALVAPLIRVASGGEARPDAARVRATLATAVRPATGRRMLRMVGVVGEGSEMRAYPIEKRSGAVTLLAQADGYVDVPEDVARLEAGEPVDVILFEERSRTPDVLFMGSHCLGLVPVFRAMAPLDCRSVHVGSLGGIRAVTRGIADVAGLHLRDQTGEYNVPVLREMRVRGVALVRGYRRMQGWILPAGNPARVRGLSDVIDRGLRIVNRTPGSGTRLLFDELLRDEASRRGVEDAEAIAAGVAGADVEAATHSAVAAAVRDGLADAGLGIEAAAALNGLSFVPIVEERYDFLLAIPALEGTIGRALIAALRGPDLRGALLELPGYRRDAETGVTVWRSAE